MPDVRDGLRDGLRSALEGAGVDGAPVEIAIERPRDRSHGEWSSNVALAAAKAAGRPPRELAEQIVAHLSAEPPPHVVTVEAAGPGFVNFRLAPSWLHEVLGAVIDAGVDGYARSTEGAGRSVSVEFVSANPTGPLHAGHGRWAAYGDSLCRLLERCGYAVYREFYVNDRGRQIDLFTASLEARSRGAEPADDGYHGEYVAEWAAEMPDTAEVRQWGLERAHRDQAETLAAMNVSFDLYTSESALVARGAMDSVLDELCGREMVYENDGAVWLRTGEFGDSADRVLVKSDSEPTYFLPDIAYHHEKFSRGDLVIDILGADHHGYVPRMRAALAALGHNRESYEALIGQNVTLRRGGVEVRLSKRAGDMVIVSELLDEVGPDVTRLVYLLQSIDTTQTIDIDVVSAQSSENPVYYLQYAHARIHSLGRQAEARGVQRAALDGVDLAVLVHERELDVLRALAGLPDTVAAAMRARAPHQVTTWARELAAAFHRFWHDCPILRDDVGEDLRQARLWLVEATRIGLTVALAILGVSAPERL
ncbi:MAG: arginine--tRNA ligase [Acidimicrobiaceae bacterium]|nr:arginine--tRNA ligase [Acidimicrobiaceae bacterium]